ncbi:MAG: sulfate adenylyltransferase, partial [Deltaproteobacteria bacterium]|nr:sulfate adenylyltransferase [Deltaproteobacteria bacterium]
MSTVNGDPITPHGGNELVELKVPAAERPRLRAYAEKLPAVTLNARDLADLEMLATGAFSPLTGYMVEADYSRSRDEMRLASGVPWPIPITLGVEEAAAQGLSRGQEVAL